MIYYVYKQSINKIKKIKIQHVTSKKGIADMEKQLWSGGALLAPVPPVLVTCGTVENPNVLTVAWTGIINTQPPKTYISIRPERFSYPLIKQSGEFVINLTTTEMAKDVDFCGVRSGHFVNKFEKTMFTPVPSSKLGCPMIDESPLSLECRVFQEIPIGTHNMFLADIIAVNVDASLLDHSGKLHLDHAKLLAYAHGEYFELGKKLGSFGFSVRKKPVHTQGKIRHKNNTSKRKQSR